MQIRLATTDLSKIKRKIHMFIDKYLAMKDNLILKFKKIMLVEISLTVHQILDKLIKKMKKSNLNWLDLLICTGNIMRLIELKEKINIKKKIVFLI